MGRERLAESEAEASRLNNECASLHDDLRQAERVERSLKAMLAAAATARDMYQDLEQQALLDRDRLAGELELERGRNRLLQDELAVAREERDRCRSVLREVGLG